MKSFLFVIAAFVLASSAQAESFKNLDQLNEESFPTDASYMVNPKVQNKYFFLAVTEREFNNPSVPPSDASYPLVRRAHRACEYFGYSRARYATDSNAPIRGRYASIDETGFARLVSESATYFTELECVGSRRK